MHTPVSFQASGLKQQVIPATVSTSHSCTAWLQVISAPGCEECNDVLCVIHGGFPFRQVSPPALLPYLQ